LKSGRQLFGAFQKFDENLGNVLTNWKKGITLEKKIVHALSAFKKVL
jgi:hypothetical protein